MSSDLESAFEGDSDVERRTRRRRELAARPVFVSPERSDAPPGEAPLTRHLLFDEVHRQTAGYVNRFHRLSAYEQHKMLINHYVLSRPGAVFARDTSRDRTDLDVIRENHKFVWSPADVTAGSWEKALAKRYHDKLFKEYCICDLTYYKLSKVALRWRVEREVVSGKGQFECGSKRCEQRNDLRSWEVNFAYMEAGERKNCLVKLRLCPECSRKLNYRRRRKEVTKLTKRKRSTKKSKTQQLDSGTSGDDAEASAGASASGPASGPSREADDDNIWKQPVHVDEEKSREEEFDDFLSDLFL